MSANRNLHMQRTAEFGFAFGDNKDISIRKPPVFLKEVLF